MNEATPGPWKAVASRISADRTVRAANGVWICTVDTEIAKQIVHAVNAHEKLVEACKSLVRDLATFGEYHMDVMPVSVTLGRNALADAGETT